MCKNFKSIFPKFLKYFQARDNDTGAYSDLRFSLSDSIQGSGQSSYFSIDPMSGMVSTSKAFDRVQRDTLPFRLSVIVTDNPGDSENSKMEKTMLVVSVPLFLYVFLTPPGIKTFKLLRPCITEPRPIVEEARIFLLLILSNKLRP